MLAGRPKRRLSDIVRDRVRIWRDGTWRRFSPVSTRANGDLHVPLLILAEATFHTPLRKQASFLRQLRRQSRSPILSSPRADFEIESLADFPIAFTRLARLLGHPQKSLRPDESEFLAGILNRRSLIRGTIAVADCLFLIALIEILEPRRVVEIGTLTGFSAAIIAASLARQPAIEGGRWVDTIDIRQQCLIDQSRPTGFEIAERFPEFAPMIRLHAPCDASVMGTLAARDELQLAFIDAHHGHPMPLLDLLRLAPYMQKGAWIVLHDIKLGTLSGPPPDGAAHRTSDGRCGSEWMFDYWPWQKFSCGDIGAVQLPEDKRELIPFSLFLMSLPFELKREEGTRRQLYRSLAELIA